MTKSHPHGCSILSVAGAEAVGFLERRPAGSWAGSELPRDIGAEIDVRRCWQRVL